MADGYESSADEFVVAWHKRDQILVGSRPRRGPELTVDAQD